MAATRETTQTRPEDEGFAAIATGPAATTDAPTTSTNTPLERSGSQRRAVSGAGLLSKIPFMRPTSTDEKARHAAGQPFPDSSLPSSAMTGAQQQQQQQHHHHQKTRRRRGSLRKVALLGRGAQRERRDAKQLTIDTSHAAAGPDDTADDPTTAAVAQEPSPSPEIEGLGLTTHTYADLHPGPSIDSNVSKDLLPSSPSLPTGHIEGESSFTSPTIPYQSTTDEDDVLRLPATHSHTNAASPSLSSASDTFYGNRAATTLGPMRNQSILHPKSPLSYSGLSNTPIPSADTDMDYSETEWWGWVILIVTWIVFVVGMGSCLGTWSWAWDVGTTPYAPPELEDDPTLPIVGYYPALIILTAIMAWIWVVVAWVGMKYFRHAKISGD